jgi:methylglyoxal synthase
MKLTPLGANRNEVDLGNGLKVLFSYKTPVAYSQSTPEGLVRYKTSTKWSRTTSKHITQWFHEYDGEVSQESIDDLIDKGGIQC